MISQQMSAMAESATSNYSLFKVPDPLSKKRLQSLALYSSSTIEIILILLTGARLPKLALLV